MVMDPQHSMINIGGLAIGLATCFLIMLFVRDELSFDQWIPDAERIASVEITFSIPGQKPLKFALSPGPVGSAAVDYFSPDIEAFTRIYNPSDTVIIDNNEYAETISYVDSGFFDVFDLDMITGERESAVNEGNRILLNEEMAHKFFGEADPLNKTLTIRQSGSLYDYTVAGVFKNLPQRTHLSIQIIAYLEPARFLDQPYILDDWTSANTFTYLKFASSESLKATQDQLENFVNDRFELALSPQLDSYAKSDLIRLNVMPVNDIYLHSGAPGYDRPLGDINTVLAFSAIAVLILILAIVNFMNLSISKSMQKAREVSVRKVLGANRLHIIVQFIGDAVFTSLTALLIALVLVELVLPAFNAFTMKSLVLSLIDDLPQTVIFIMMALFAGVIGGVYPAFVIARHHPGLVLRANQSSGSSSGSDFLRQSLIAFQFSISIILVISTIVVFGQTNYARNVDLGFDKENRLVLSGMLRGDMHEIGQAIRSELLALPGVKLAAFSQGIIPETTRNYNAVTISGVSTDPLNVESVKVGFGFFEVFGIETLAGRTFSEAFQADDFPRTESETAMAGIVVNENFAEKAGYSDPGDAIGKMVSVSSPLVASGQVVSTIVGVVNDIRSRSATVEITPQYYYLDSEPQFYLSLLLQTDDMTGTMAGINTVWDRMVPQRPLISYFVEERLDALYAANEKQGEMFAAFSMFAIFVAALGLYGLSRFNVVQRTREVGIRKVMGATALNIVRLFVWQFSKPVVVANIIAWPIAWFFMREWLNEFAYRIELSLIPFVIAGLVAFLISLSTVGSQVYGVARSKPIQALRYE
jgi:putative ABC transport system permease protein